MVRECEACVHDGSAAWFIEGNRRSQLSEGDEGDEARILASWGCRGEGHLLS